MHDIYSNIYRYMCVLYVNGDKPQVIKMKKKYLYKNKKIKKKIFGMKNVDIFFPVHPTKIYSSKK